MPENGVYVTQEGPNAEPEIETRLRRMPAELRRFLLRVQGGKLYLPVNMRLVWFRDSEETRNWGIETRLLEGGHEAAFATMQAFIYNEEGRLIASDVKTETKADFPAGWVEKASTGAIGRALAVAGFGTQFDPTLFEYDHTGHVTEAPIKHPGNKAPATGRPAGAQPPKPESDIKPLQDRLVATARQRGVRTAELVATYAPSLKDKGTGNLNATELQQVLDTIASADGSRVPAMA